MGRNSGGIPVMKINKYSLLLCGFAVLLFTITNYFWSRADKKKFLKFYNTNINGPLTDILPHKGVVDITVNNQKFTFAPIYTNDQTELRFFVKIGDSVFKAAKSDTLKLIHDGKAYLYTFVKM